MTSSLIWANSRIKSRETKLLTADRLQRLLDCGTVADAVKVLAEFGFCDGTEANTEKLLLANRRELINFIKELNLDEPLVTALLYRYDFHNAKALMKAKYMRLNQTDELLLPSVNWDIDKLKENTIGDTYGDYVEAQEAFMTVDEAFASGRRSPKLIDTTFDKAYFAYAEKLTAKDAYAKHYIEIKEFFVNLSAFLRCKKLNLDLKQFEEQYVGTQDGMYEAFKASFEQGIEALLSKLKFTEFGGYVDAVIEMELSAVEKHADDTLIKYLKEKQNALFTGAVAAGYVVAREQEQNAVGLILTGLKNNVDKSVIRARLRVSYGG